MVFRGKTKLFTAIIAAFITSSVNLVAMPNVSDVTAVGTANIIDKYSEAVMQAKSSMLMKPGRALEFAKEAETYAARMPEEDRNNAMVTSMWLQGEAIARLNRVFEAEDYIQRAHDLLRDQSGELGGELLLSRGRLAAQSGDLPVAMANFEGAFEVFKALDLKRNQAVALHNIAKIYEQAGIYKKVLEYDARAMAVYSGDPSLDLYSYLHRAKAAIFAGNIESAFALNDEALEVARASENEGLIVWVLQTRAKFLIQSRRFIDAQSVIDEAIEIMAAAEPTAWNSQVWGTQAELNLERGEIDVALSNINKAFEGVDISNTSSMYQDLHGVAVKIFETSGDKMQAFEHLKAFTRINDQTHAISIDANKVLAEMKFELANKELELEKLHTSQLESDFALVQEREKFRNIVATFSIFFAVGVAAFFTWAYFSTRRANRITERLNTELAVKNDALGNSREQCLEGGMDEFLVKPVQPMRLEQVMVKALHKRQARVA